MGLRDRVEALGGTVAVASPAIAYAGSYGASESLSTRVDRRGS
jgi:hypothetical protein